MAVAVLQVLDPHQAQPTAPKSVDKFVNKIMLQCTKPHTAWLLPFLGVFLEILMFIQINKLNHLLEVATRLRCKCEGKFRPDAKMCRTLRLLTSRKKMALK